MTVTFSVPLKDSKTGGFFNFTVETGAVLFAGSRHVSLPDTLSLSLVRAFRSRGFSFLTGCASGVDESFRHAFSLSGYKDSSLVACAFRDRQRRIKDLTSLFVVPDGLPPKVALAKRTLWLTNRCSILVLFPDDPIGKGSALAFKSAIYTNKPVFVASKTRPEDSNLYTVLPSNLFGVVDGFWCVTPVYKDTGLTYETV